MSSELLGSAQNVLKGNLGGAWDITNGYQDAYTDLGIARRFGGAATAYSLRDIGAMNGRVVKVRRDVDGDGTDKEEDFSANQVQSGALEDWVNGKLESTLPADVATAAAAYSLRKVKADYSGEAVRIRRSSDDVEVDVAFDSDDKVSTSSSISVVSGSTSATTLGDFINGTDAFVHTWYDQAGSNDAVQATAANQPKIAESGALLTDGIDFDGSNDRLDITNSLPITGANARSVFTIVNKDVSSSSDNILGIGDNGSGVNSQLWNLATTYGLYYNGGNTVFGAGALNTNQLVTAIYPSSASDSGDTVLFINSVSSSITSNVDTTLATDNTVARIGAGGGSAGGNLDGSLQELIIYASDQSDNRFKIESNINNYYGLYNDANDMATDWSDDPTAPYGSAFTSNGKDGYSIDYSAGVASKRARWQFADNVPSGDVIYYSFNASITSGTPAVILKQSNGTSNANSTSVAITNGFNSGSITTNAEAVYFAIGDTESTQNYSISDFKVSRIARNGFIETWYDQSANLRDAIQETATNQPAIVQNGGIVKVNSKPAITFDGNDNFLEVDGSGSAVAYSFSPSGDMGMFIVSKQSTGNPVDSRDGAGDGIFLQQASADTTRFRYNGDGSIDITATRDAQHFSTMTLDGTTLSASVDGGTAGTDTVTAGVSTTSNLVLGKAFSGNNSNFVDGEIQEAIFYENNKTSEKSDIETDIDNFYSIT